MSAVDKPDLHHSQGVDVAEVRRRMGDSNDIDPRDLPPGWLLHVHDRLDELDRHIDRSRNETADAVAARVTAALMPEIEKIHRFFGVLEQRVKSVERRADDHEAHGKSVDRLLAAHDGRIAELERKTKATRRKAPTKGKHK